VFASPPDIETRVFTSLPDEFRQSRQTHWANVHLRGQELDSFLEGPSFDLEGNLYVVDIAFGRVFRISPDGIWTLIVEYDGQPNGLKLDREGKIFIADRKHGILELELHTGATKIAIDGPKSERFMGVNDLFFASDGTLYFTDQGQTGINDLRGRLYRRRHDGVLECLLNSIPSPNGLVMNADETVLYLAVTRANSVWRVPFSRDGSVSKVGVFIQLSGGLAGPDGLALDEVGNIAVAHAGLGTVWLFSPLGEPIARVRSCAGVMTTNVAYGGDDRKNIYITESETGKILIADMPFPGKSIGAKA